MQRDPIVEETRKLREEYAASLGHELPGSGYRRYVPSALTARLRRCRAGGRPTEPARARRCEHGISVTGCLAHVARNVLHCEWTGATALGRVDGANRGSEQET